MKALNLHGVDDLRYEDVELPKRMSDEVTVRIKAAGICGSDIPRIFTKGTYRFPTIPGHEFAGEIVDADDKNFLNKNVSVYPLIPCGKCEACKIGEYQLCSNYDYYGSRRDGAFAEYLNVKKSNLVFLPDNIPIEVAAMCEPISVSLHAIKRGNVKGKKTVAVWGLGPIGFILANWLKVFEVPNIILVARDDVKVDIAMHYGFKHVINARKINPPKYINDLTHGIGADVCIEGTGSSKALAQCLLSCKRFGTVVNMGNPTSDMTLSQNEYWAILRKELRLVGTWNSRFNDFDNDWEDAVNALSSKKLDLEKLITHKFPLFDYKKAFSIMRDKTEYHCKIMFINK